MVIKEIEIKKPDGVQNRDAQAIVQRTMRYDSEIYFEWKSRKINAKSLMGVISMGLKDGDKIMVIVKGHDQDEAVADLENLFCASFQNIIYGSVFTNGR